MQNKLSPILPIVALLLLSIVVSCGYRFTPVGNIVPENAKTIAVPVFLNATNEPSVDVELTKAVAEEFLTDGRMKVANLDEADIVLRGKIIKFVLMPIAYRAPVANMSNVFVQTYNVSMVVRFSLEDTKKQKVLLEEKGLGSTFIASYPVTLGDETTSGVTVTKMAKEAAMQKACKDLASTIRSRVLDGF